MRTGHTDDVYLFRWDRDAVTELELTYRPSREEWSQRARHDRAGWSDPVVVALPRPEDDQDAERLAKEWSASP